VEWLTLRVGAESRLDPPLNGGNIMGNGETIVFCDTENTDFDSNYAKRLRQAFRNLTGWEVKKKRRFYYCN